MEVNTTLLGVPCYIQSRVEWDHASKAKITTQGCTWVEAPPLLSSPSWNYCTVLYLKYPYSCHKLICYTCMY